MNRSARRAYEQKIRKDKRASICPKCGYRSLFFSTSIPTGEFDVETKDDGMTVTKPKYTAAIKCEVCDSIIYMGEDVEKLVPPGIYLPLPIDIFDYALRHPEMLERTEDAEKTVDNSSNLVQD